MERITTEYTATIDDIRAKINELIGLNKKAQAEADKTGKSIDDGFIKGSNGAKRFNDELKRTTRTQAELELKVKNLQELLRDDTKLGSAAFRKVQAEIRKTEAELDKLNGKAKEIPGTFKSIGAMVTGAFSLATLIQFNKELIKTQREAEILANQFAFVSGGAEAGRANFNRLRETALQLGLNFKSLSEEFASFANAARAMNIPNEVAVQVFEDMAFGLRGAGASAQQQQSAFLALTQIMSKGRLMGQELTLQLGNAIPGATGIAAKALGVTTGELNKLMADGQVFAEDFVPKFAAAVREQFAGALAGKSDSLDASIERATSSWERFKRAISNIPLNRAIFDGVGQALENNSIILESNISKTEKLYRIFFETFGLGQKNYQFLLEQYQLEQERQKAAEARLAAANEEAKRINGLAEGQKQMELNMLKYNINQLNSLKKTRELTTAEQARYESMTMILQEVDRLEGEAATKKQRQQEEDLKNQEKLLELQKKRDKALKDYIDTINKAFQEVHAMHKQDEDNILDSIASLQSRSKREQQIRDKNKAAEEKFIQEGRERNQQSLNDQIADSDKAFKTNQENEDAALKQREQAYRDFYQTIQGLANDFLSYQLQLVRSETQQRIDSLRLALETNRISEEEYNARVIELKRQQFEREKSIARGQALINGALAATNILANWAGKNPIIAAALLGLTAVSVGAQIATINAQTPGFKEGVIDLQGPGTSTSDSIVARLSKGESVMTAVETKQHREELMAMRKGTFDDLIIEKYIAPALIEQKQKQNGFAANLARSIQVQSAFDDTEMVHAIRRNKKVELGEKTLEALRPKSGISKALGRRGR